MCLSNTDYYCQKIYMVIKQELLEKLHMLEKLLFKHIKFGQVTSENNLLNNREHMKILLFVQ